MPKLTPLDVLRARGRILDEDFAALRRFGELAARADRRGSESADGLRFAAATDALLRAGTTAHSMVRLVVIIGSLPQTEAGLRGLQDGADALHRHFKRRDPPAQPRRAEGCRPRYRPVRLD